MISFHNVSIRLDGFSLEEVDFQVPTGSYAVLMGKTGCGKTTILEAVCGLRPIAAGQVRLMNRDVTTLPPGQRNIGLVPQDGALFSTMTVEEHLGFALRIRKAKTAEVRQRTSELAEWLGLTHLLHRRPHGLSGGERQRVAVGRALAARPDVLCLDEPLSALDELTHGEMIQLLRSVHQQSGVTVLHITHNRREAKALAQLLLVLQDGCLFDGQEATAHLKDVDDEL